MNLDYTLRINKREARSRSKRMQNLGITPSGAVVGAGGASDHTHSNLAHLNRFISDSDGYGYLSSVVTIVDPESGEPRSENIEDKIKAGYADMAWDLADGSPAEGRFVSRLKDDVVKGRVEFERRAVFDDGIEIGGVRLSWDDENGALRIDRSVYSTGGVTALGWLPGVGPGGDGGGGGVAYDRLDDWAEYDAGRSGWVLSAGLGWGLRQMLEGFGFADLKSRPDSLAGYGIKDTRIEDGVITIGGVSLTPLTAADSREFVASVGTSGRFLTYMKGGVRYDVTVPWAQNAGMLAGMTWDVNMNGFWSSASARVNGDQEKTWYAKVRIGHGWASGRREFVCYASYLNVDGVLIVRRLGLGQRFGYEVTAYNGCNILGLCYGAESGNGTVVYLELRGGKDANLFVKASSEVTVEVLDGAPAGLVFEPLKMFYRSGDIGAAGGVFGNLTVEGATVFGGKVTVNGNLTVPKHNLMGSWVIAGKKPGNGGGGFGMYDKDGKLHRLMRFSSTTSELYIGDECPANVVIASGGRVEVESPVDIKREAVFSGSVTFMQPLGSSHVVAGGVYDYNNESYGGFDLRCGAGRLSVMRVNSAGVLQLGEETAKAGIYTRLYGRGIGFYIGNDAGEADLSMEVNAMRNVRVHKDFSVGGDVCVEGVLRIGRASLRWDESSGALRLEGDLVATGGVTALG